MSPDVASWSLTAGRSLIESVPDGVLVLDGGGAVVLHNQAAAALFGVPAGQLVGERPLNGAWAFVDVDGKELQGEDNPLRHAARDVAPLIRLGVGIRRKDSPIRWVHLRVRPLGQVPGIGNAISVVLERAPDPRATRSLHSVATLADGPQRLLDSLFSQRSVGMVHSLTDGTVLRTNDAFATMVDREVTDVVGAKLPHLIDPDDLEREEHAIRRLVKGGSDHIEAEVRLRRRDGTSISAQLGCTSIRDEEGRCESLVTMVVDVSRLRRAEHFMSSRALFDPLTQLINRSLLLDLLGDQLRVADGRMAVIALNLDRFRAVNDSLGLSTGDAVLVEVARRLRGVLNSGDAAARISGDDFVLLCGGTLSRIQADALTQRVLDAVAEPFEIDGLRIQLTASAGVAMIEPDAALTADEVMYQATAALSHAKQHGRARWKVFDREMEVQSTDRLRIETNLRAALVERRLQVAYQPVLDLRSDVIVGAEALLRWHDPMIGTIAPAVFLPVAEETGLIVSIGEFVLDDAVQRVTDWRRGRQPAHVAVNLSPNELNRRGIAERVAEALDEASLPSSALRLEITESVLVDADAQVRQNLSELQALGVAVGIDDFGTGYASMSYLRTLPVDFVKIDKTFVSGLSSSKEDRAIVRATLDLATALDLGTVAEGIETPDQLDIVRELGCELAQGYLIGRPDQPGLVEARLPA